MLYRKLRSTLPRLMLLIALGFVLTLVALSGNAQAAGTFNSASLPDPRAQLEYERLVNPAQSAESIQAAFAKSESLPVGTSLPAALADHTVASTSTTPIRYWTNGDQVPGGTWTSVGPSQVSTSLESTNSASGPAFGPYSGRTTSIAVVPGTSGAATNIYVGTVGGGIWKTINNGTTWTPLTDSLVGPFTPSSSTYHMPANMIGALAIDASYTLAVYAGSGEGNLCNDCGYSSGLFKTINGGITWFQTAPTQFVSTSSSSYSFQKINAYGASVWVATNHGLWHSANANLTTASYTKNVAATALWNGFTTPYISDMAVYGSTIYVAAFDASKIFSGPGSANAGIYRSINSGSTWVNITPSGITNGISPTNLGRIAFALAPTSPTTLYVLASDLQGNLMGAYKTTTATTATNSAGWTVIFQPTLHSVAGYNSYQYLGTHATPLNGIYTDPCSGDGEFAIGQCWYGISAAVDPGNANYVYLGGVDTAFSADGGASWTNITRVYGASPSPVHPFQHAISFNAASVNGKRVAYFANDGGVFTSSNAGLTWSNLNTNLSTLESFYTAGGTNFANQHVLWSGMQGSGNGKYTGNLAWQQLLTGDGGYAAIDPNFQVNVFAETGHAGLQSSTDGGLHWNNIAPALAGNTLFVTPFIMDPSATSNITIAHHLLVGEDAVLETTDSGQNWCQASQVLSGDALGSGIPISALAIAPSNSTVGSEVMYAALSGSRSGTVTQLWTTSAGYASTSNPCPSIPTWSSADTGGSLTGAGFITDLAVDPTDSLTVYATIAAGSNSSSITGASDRVWETNNGGGFWYPIDATLPNTNFNSVITYSLPNSGRVVIVAGDTGVYYSTNAYKQIGGNSWTAITTGLPMTPINKIRADWAHSTLIASTHGRVFGPFLSRTRPVQGVGWATRLGYSIQVVLPLELMIRRTSSCAIS